MKIKGLLTAALLLPFCVTPSYAEEQVETPAVESATEPETSAQAEAPAPPQPEAPAPPQAAAPALPPKLSLVDADQDGKISRDELVAFIVKRAKERIAEKAGRLDTDGDKCLSKAELKGKNKLKVRFDDVDSDKDGKISREEAVAFVKKRADERAAKLFLKIDSNKDGFITADEVKKKTENKVEESAEEEDL